MASEPDAVTCDTEAARLLPWHVIGRLAPADEARVVQHLASCATCRDDLAQQRALRARLRDDGPLEYAPQAGLAATLARIDELEREVPAGHADGQAADASPAGVSRPARVASRPIVRWLAAAAIVQAVGLAWLGLLAWPSHRAVPRGGYVTLSAPAPAAPGARVRVVFAPGATLAQLGDLLGPQGLQVLAGPTEAGVYTLGNAAGDGPQAAPLDSTLRALRASPLVRFAEPAGPEAR